MLPLFEFCKGRLNIEIQIRIRELIAIASRVRTFINIFHRAVYTESVYLQRMDFIQKARIRILQRITRVAIGVIRPHQNIICSVRKAKHTEEIHHRMAVRVVAITVKRVVEMLRMTKRHIPFHHLIRILLNRFLGIVLHKNLPLFLNCCFCLFKIRLNVFFKYSLKLLD